MKHALLYRSLLMHYCTAGDSNLNITGNNGVVDAGGVTTNYALHDNFCK